MEQHVFTQKIQQILAHEFGDAAGKIFNTSFLVQYLNKKTRSANRSSKSRGSFANLYALYVLIEDYLQHDYDQSGDYSQYEGASYTRLLRRQRELPFGEKLQNHGLNHRMNEEFKKFFPLGDYIPILSSAEKVNTGLTRTSCT